MKTVNIRWKYPYWIWMWFCMVASVKAQDSMPAPSVADKPLVVEAAKVNAPETLACISIGNSMPGSFQSTADNVILDPE